MTMKRTGFKPPTLEKVIAWRNKPRTPLKASKSLSVRSGKPKDRKRLKHRDLMPQRVKRAKKQPISLIQKKLWIECKRIIRNTYPPICFTCGVPISGSNDHTSHFIPKASCGAFLKYDLRNLRRCCYNCNINLGGNGSMFYRRLLETEGQEYIDGLFKDKEVIVKAYDHYVLLLEKYKSMTNI